MRLKSDQKICGLLSGDQGGGFWKNGFMYDNCEKKHFSQEKNLRKTQK